MRPSCLLRAMFGAASLAMPLNALDAQMHGPHAPADSETGPGVPRHAGLGTHHYAVTASPESQIYFDQGLRLLWAFNHAEAVRSFREAERRDPGCGMCAWGIALASGPNINASLEPEGRDTALAAIARARKQLGRLSPVESGWIEALARRFGTDEAQAGRDSAYAAAMGTLAERFPEDLEIRTFLADALMNQNPWNYYDTDGTPRPGTTRILASLEYVLARNPNHPGACHLYVHAVESHHPAQGVDCAERLAKAMPGAGHLVHMPGHIYIRVGRYADAVLANQHAVHADQALLEGPGALRRGLYAQGYFPHNWHFMSFAASMLGASRVAIDAAYRAARGVTPAVALAYPWVEAVTPIHYWTLVTFGRWDAILAEPLPTPALRFATGMAYYARGVAFAAKRRWAEAAAAYDSVTAVGRSYPEGDNRIALDIAALGVLGEIALRGGRADDAVSIFQDAVDREDALAYNEPPTWYYPMRHSLGKALLAAHRPGDAERVYRQDLDRFPENGWALFGLRESLERQGRHREARAVAERFRKAWGHADITLTASRF